MVYEMVELSEAIEVHKEIGKTIYSIQEEESIYYDQATVLWITIMNKNQRSLLKHLECDCEISTEYIFVAIKHFRKITFFVI